jgi:hypothetical protein
MKQSEIKIGMAVWHNGKIWYTLYRTTDSVHLYRHDDWCFAPIDTVRITQTYPLQNSIITIK